MAQPNFTDADATRLVETYHALFDLLNENDSMQFSSLSASAGYGSVSEMRDDFALAMAAHLCVRSATQVINRPDISISQAAELCNLLDNAAITLPQVYKDKYFSSRSVNTTVHGLRFHEGFTYLTINFLKTMYERAAAMGLSLDQITPFN